MPKRTMVLVVLMMLIATSDALANSGTALVMHAVETTFGHCEIDDPYPNPGRDVPVGAHIAAYLVIRHYVQVAAVQTAFDWSYWMFVSGLWDCQANQICSATPTPPGGATAGTLTTSFDAIVGGASAVIGRMHLLVRLCPEDCV